jgi:hypothetical protein
VKEQALFTAYRKVLASSLLPWYHAIVLAD